MTTWSARFAAESAKRAVKMTERWKANTRLSTAPWKSRKPRFPHFHSSGGGGFYGTTEGLKQQKLKPFTQKPLHLRKQPKMRVSTNSCAEPFFPGSAEDRSSLFVWFIDTTARSDSSRACASAVWLWAFADRPRSLVGRGAPEVSRIRCFLSCRALSSPTTYRFIPALSESPTIHPKLGCYFRKLFSRE